MSWWNSIMQIRCFTQHRKREGITLFKSESLLSPQSYNLSFTAAVHLLFFFLVWNKFSNAILSQKVSFTFLFSWCIRNIRILPIPFFRTNFSTEKASNILDLEVFITTTKDDQLIALCGFSQNTPFIDRRIHSVKKRLFGRILSW